MYFVKVISKSPLYLKSHMNKNSCNVRQRGQEKFIQLIYRKAKIILHNLRSTYTKRKFTEISIR